MRFFNAALVSAVFSLVFFQSATAQGFGAFPISQAVEVTAGRTSSLTFELLNFGEDPMTLDVTHSYVPSQLTTDQINAIGNARLRKLMLDRPSDHGSWMSIPSEVTMLSAADGEATVLEIPIEVPLTASGTVSGTIIFTQQTDSLLRLAYRCSYVLSVGNRPFVRDIVVENVEITQENGATQLDATVTNIGNANFDIAGEYALFRRVGARKTPVLKDSLEPATLQPGQPTSVSNSLQNVLASGLYEVRLLAELDGSAQRPRVIEYEFEGPFEAGGLIQGSEIFGGPNLAIVPIGPRARRNVPYFIENTTDKPVTVDLSIEGQIVDGLGLQIIPNSLSIGPSSTGRFRVMAQADENLTLDAPSSAQLIALIKNQDQVESKHEFSLWFENSRAEQKSEIGIESAVLDVLSGTINFDLVNRGSLPVTPMGAVVIYTQIDEPLIRESVRINQIIYPDQRITASVELDEGLREAWTDLSNISDALQLNLGLDVSHPAMTDNSPIETRLEIQ